MDTVRETGLELKGLMTVAPKKEAILAGRIDMLELLLHRDNFVDDQLVGAACDRRDRQRLRLLLNSGWSINQSFGVGGGSALRTAINDVAFAQWLIDNGADVDLRSQLDESALSAAIAFGSMDVVQVLLSHGTDCSHGNLIHYAAQRADENEGASLIAFLVRKGADVNAHRHDNPTGIRWRALFKSQNPSPHCVRKSKYPTNPHFTRLRCGAASGNARGTKIGPAESV
ncbi:ankyrin [Teratosphaeria nubilosa]|uniref:Ankyrin n=1 Tax=Teratosphaeria nubilosa TaxID=161662 RepID=A0A6G1L686_9PEZI|nr:ankyrin [Teratosphaeria nubilosa]